MSLDSLPPVRRPSGDERDASGAVRGGIRDSQLELAERYRDVRAMTLRLREPLTEEDCAAQSMPDASPVKWHLAHTTWFFETFVLIASADYRRFDPAYAVLFNSYYNSVGEQYSRPERGLLTRPSLAEITAYRSHVDTHMEQLFEAGISIELTAVIELGLHHEQQHQELILTDLKHLLSRNPMKPAYLSLPEPQPVELPPLGWQRCDEGLYWIGHEGDGFHFDNEGPRHRVFLNAFSLATRLVSNGEFLEFMADGGYSRPEFWLSDGWACVQQHGWNAPLYWQSEDANSRKDWRVMTLAGVRDLQPGEPLSHVSYYEADAFASWAGARLPSEAEWEVVASRVAQLALSGDADAGAGARPVANFVDEGHFHPRLDAPNAVQPSQLFGDVWEWTRSPYSAYPSFAPNPGVIGEYNGKFMCNQMVLRGGSCASSRAHLRVSYRNFFHPDARWQFSGVRLARDADPVDYSRLS